MSMHYHRMIIFVSFVICLLSGVQSAKVTFTNNCDYKVWPATLTGDQKPQLSSTGFELAPKASNSLTVPAPWSGRMWARTGCTTNAAGKFTCETGDCASGQVGCNGAGGNPPATLIEFTLAPNNGQDFFDVSLVDGFNLPAKLTPQGGAGNCPETSCPANVNAVCPTELAVKGGGGATVGCKSACLALNQPQYCCTGSFNTEPTCPPTNYSKLFSAQCPQAYSYAYDDKKGTFTCTGGPDYLITFCP